jgi:chemotaxis protein MotB
MRTTYFFILLLFTFSSCIVSKKKFDDMLAQKVKAEGDLSDRNKELDKANGSLQDLAETIKNKEYEQLNGNYKNLLTNSGKLNRDVAQQRDQLLAIQDNLEKTRKQNDSLSYSLLEREKKVKELELIMANKDKAVQNLKNKISNALLNFKENDLTVKVKNGKVYVSLAEQLLFGSGSIDVDAKGVGALQQLAKALKDQKDIQVMIEGHTDNVPISKKSTYMNDNWDLSVMRATSITKILTGAGLSPNQITAAGKGEYAPLAPNDNAQNKQKNRRTEIIVTPNLDELFKILEAN